MRLIALLLTLSPGVALAGGPPARIPPPFAVPPMHGRSGEDLREVYLYEMVLPDIYMSRPEILASPDERACMWAEFGANFASVTLKLQYPELELPDPVYESAHGKGRFAREIAMTAADHINHDEVEHAGTVFEEYVRQFCLSIKAARYGRLHKLIIEYRSSFLDDVERSSDWQRAVRAIGRASACDGMTGLCAESSYRYIPGRVLFEAALMMAAGFLTGPFVPAHLPVRWTISGELLLRAAGGP